MRLKGTRPPFLEIEGPIDETDLTELRHAVSAAADRSRHLVVNLCEVTYLPSAAIGILATARVYARKRGRRITLLARADCVSGQALATVGVTFSQTSVIGLISDPKGH